MLKMLIQLGSERRVRLFSNPGRFPKGDGEKQHSQPHRQDQNVSNAFHVTKYPKNCFPYSLSGDGQNCLDLLQKSVEANYLSNK